MTMPCRQLLLLGLGGLILMGSSRATAQERLTLSESDEWTKADVVDPSTAEGQLSRIRKALADEEYDRAENLATQWIDRHPEHPLAAEAYLLRADSFRGRRDYYESLFDYEYVARMFPGSEVFVKALERELEIAKLYAGGMKRKFWGMRLVDASDEAQELLIRIQERMPGSRLAEEAGLALADYYFAHRKMSLAVDAYELFIENYPRSEHVSKARRRLIFSHLASFKGPEFDASGLYDARTLLREFQVLEPAAAQRAGADALLVRVEESDAKKLLTTAQWYLRTGNYVSAEITIRRLIQKYPRSVATAVALRLMSSLRGHLSAFHLRDAPDYEGLRGGVVKVSSKSPPEVTPEVTPDATPDTRVEEDR